MMHLKIEAEISLCEPTVDRGYVTWLTVQIWTEGDDDTDEQPKEIGRAHFALIHFRLEANMFEVLDADSSTLEALTKGYLGDDGQLREELQEGGGNDLLYLDEIELADGWTGRNIELALVRRMADTIGSGCELVVVRPDEMRDKRFWEQMGFKTNRLDADYMQISMAYVAPRIAEVDDDRGERFRILPSRELLRFKKDHH